MVARRPTQGLSLPEDKMTQLFTGVQKAIALVILGACVVAGAMADDSSIGVPIPVLHSEPADSVRLKSSFVTLRGANITVDFALATRAGSPVKVTWVGPLFGWLGESEPYPDRQFPELAVELDGRPVQPEDYFEAFVGDKDVTGLLLAAHLNPWSIAETPPFATPDPNNVVAVSELERAGVLEKSGSTYIAKWMARRSWKLVLPTAGDRILRLSYSARPAYAAMKAGTIATKSRKQRYCLTSKQLRAVLGSNAQLGFVTVVEYAIPTGLDGTAPRTVKVSGNFDGAIPGYRAVASFACDPHGAGVVTTGALTGQSLRTDKGGMLRVLTVGGASPALH